MSYETNTIEIKTLDAITARAPSKVINAINSASKRSGVDFSYLVQQAAAESSFNPHAKAKTSSATGLYQFIDSTWLSMIDKYGDKYGLNTDGMDKKEILDMRKDPKAASFMAAAFASENEKFLKSNWGGDIGATELYFAHFMGASGAASFLRARDENPMQTAADLFPRAASANRNVFYDKETGRAKSLEEVYAFFDKKFQINGNKTNNKNVKDIATPTEKLKNKMLYSANSNSLSDNIIMQRSKAMRASTNHGSLFPQNTQKLPFFSLIAQPIDVMLLTQVAAPPSTNNNG